MLEINLEGTVLIGRVRAQLLRDRMWAWPAVARWSCQFGPPAARPGLSPSECASVLHAI